MTPSYALALFLAYLAGMLVGLGIAVAAEAAVAWVRRVGYLQGERK